MSWIKTAPQNILENGERYHRVSFTRLYRSLRESCHEYPNHAETAVVITSRGFGGRRQRAQRSAATWPHRDRTAQMKMIARAIWEARRWGLTSALSVRCQRVSCSMVVAGRPAQDDQFVCRRNEIAIWDAPINHLIILDWKGAFILHNKIVIRLAIFFHTTTHAFDSCLKFLRSNYQSSPIESVSFDFHAL